MGVLTLSTLPCVNYTTLLPRPRNVHHDRDHNHDQTDDDPIPCIHDYSLYLNKPLPRARATIFRIARESL